MKALVSVIVPIYNTKKYLPRCIDSIICQSYKNLDIILVNDGSTDNSGVVCAEYGRADSRIRIITQPNSGPSFARNAGLDAKGLGDYIMFVDSDDSLMPNAIEAAYNEIVESDADYVRFGFQKLDENNAVIGTYIAEKRLECDGYTALKLLTAII